VRVADGIAAGQPAARLPAHARTGGRDDEAYLAPFTGLAFPAPTGLFLRLVHVTDGVNGTLRRVDAAQSIGCEGCTGAVLDARSRA
jgi:hypothetical protein